MEGSGIEHVIGRCSQRALPAIFFARKFAGEDGATLVDTEDLLYGLFRVTPEDFSNLSEAELLQRIHALRPPQKPQLPSSQDMGLSDDLQRCLQIAMQTATEQGCQEVRTEHLLLALVQVHTSHAAIVLDGIGLTEAELQHNMSQIDGRVLQAEPALQSAIGWGFL